eukprot:416745_1
MAKLQIILSDSNLLMLTVVWLSLSFTKSMNVVDVEWPNDLQIIRNVKGKCLTNGAYVQVWDCKISDQQKFYFKNGQIRSMGNDKCLDVHAPQYLSRENGAKVQMWDCNGGVQQQWYRSRNPSGYGHPVIKSSNGKCLDVHSPDIINNGGKIQLWDCNGAAQQEWLVTRYVCPGCSYKSSYYGRAWASYPALVAHDKTDGFNMINKRTKNDSLGLLWIYVGIITLLLIINVYVCYWCVCKDKNNKANLTEKIEFVQESNV